MTVTVVFDRKKGHIGKKRYVRRDEQQKLQCNYVVDILDPVNYSHLNTVPAVGGTEYDWHELSKQDPRYQLINLFDIIEGGHASWYYGIAGCGENAEVDEAYIENPYEVFELIRKLFPPYTHGKAI